VKDLVLLVADRSIEATLIGLLGRPRALGTRTIEFDIFTHPGRDPGCYHRAHDFLRHFQTQYRCALVVFDRAWDGAPAEDGLSLEGEVRGRLASSGWDDAADVVVIDPELEVWVWSDSPSVDECLGWRGRRPALRSWANSSGLWPTGQLKPLDPKQLFERALRDTKTPPSSSLYARLSRSVSVERCTDPSFNRLKTRLRAWFPSATPRRRSHR
jgi:hypothetical protein